MILEKPFNGELFSFNDDPLKVEAYLPTTYVSNHAASLIETEKGDLLCTWFAGSAEGSGDIKIVYSRLPKGAEKWESCHVVSKEDGHSLQNPFFFQPPGGPLYLYHTSQETRGVSPKEWQEKFRRGEVKESFTMQSTALIYRLISRDEGKTWENKEIFLSRKGSFCRHPIKILSNGDWVFTMYYSFDGEVNKQHGDDYSVVQISNDQGKTWTEYKVPESRGRVQMSIIETAPGKCVAFFRSRAADNIYRSFSEDYGKTWSPPEPTELPNNNSSVHAIGLKSGAIAIVYNPWRSENVDSKSTVWPKMRNSISIALSDDGGKTFPWIRIVEPGSGFRGKQNTGFNKGHAYPCILQSRDGAIHVAYSCLDRKYIQYVKITEGWIRTGE